MFGGGVDVWIYHEVAGLRPALADGTAQFGVEAVVMRRVGAASASTKLGGSLIASAWRYDGGRGALRYELTVPVGVAAHLTLPVAVEPTRWPWAAKPFPCRLLHFVRRIFL